MTLTAAQIFVMKKRLMDTFTELPTRDIKLAANEFGLPEPERWSDHEDLVEKIVTTLGPGQVERLHEALYESDESLVADLLDNDDNSPFSAAELERIDDALTELKRQAAQTYGLPEQELRVLHAKIDYLIESSKTSRRKDWLILAVSVISQPIVAGVLTPTVVHKALGAMAATLGSLFGHPMPMLGP